MEMPAVPMKVSEAIAREEGFYTPGTRAARNHNPGNIEWGVFARMHGATHAEIEDGKPGRFAVFPDDFTGMQACKALLLIHRGVLIAKTISIWAPPDENNTASYIANIGIWTRLDPENTLISWSNV